MKNKKIKITSGVLILFIGIVLWLLPIVAENLIEKNSKEWFGRKINIEDIDINLFTGTVKIFDFSLYELDDTTSFVSFDTLILNTRPCHYLVSKITLQQLYIKNLSTNIIKENDSTFNFDSLIDFYTTPTDSLVVNQEIDTTDVFKFSLSNIEFVNAEVVFNDQLINETFVFNELDLLIPNIEWNQEDKSNADLEFNFEDGGRFYSSTSFDPIDGNFNANIGLENLDVSVYTKYLQSFIELEAFEGLLTTNINFVGNSNYLDSLSLNGFLDLKDLKFIDASKKPILQAEEIHCVLKELQPFKNSYIIDSLKFIKPFVAFTLYKNSTNFETFLKLDEVIDEEELESIQIDSVSDLYYQLNSVSISNGKLQFNDATTSQPFQYNLSSIEANVDSINSESEWVNVKANMLLNKRGKMKVDLNINPLDPMELDLKYVVSGFKLKDLNIYSLDYMGIPVLEGDMYYKMHTKIHNGELDSQNKLIVHNATLGDKRGGLYNLPLKFALFLLKDKDGVVNLDIPVGGNLDDPSVNVNKLIWYTLKNLLIKTVASPIKFLSGLVGGEPKELESVEFSYLDTTLSNTHLKQLNKLQDLEKKKEGLIIEMLYLNDIEIEKKQIAVQQLGEQFNKEYDKNYLTDEEEFKMFLLKKTNKDTSEIETEKILDSSFVESTCVSLSNPALIDSLAKVYEEKRIEGIRKRLILSETKNHIKVKKAKADDTENIASKPVFKIIYSIEE
ncbi:DUF748 domain-containing protein [Flavicella sp.]|uniref:DUF748 domain-containing protein n=1 Tax=Flavicella sp. TaxID=2957742 RepID=UPI003018E572